MLLIVPEANCCNQAWVLKKDLPAETLPWAMSAAVARVRFYEEVTTKLVVAVAVLHSWRILPPEVGEWLP
jgi:hypothetical protein